MIDTENKRRSTVGSWVIARILPIPNGLIGLGDRIHLWLYRGLGDLTHGEISPHLYYTQFTTLHMPTLLFPRR